MFGKPKPVEVNVNLLIPFEQFETLVRKLDAIGELLAIINNKENKIMASLDETIAAVQAEDTKVDSLIALTTGIKAQLDAALAGALTADQQAKVDAIFADVNAKAATIDSAITANTPATPAP